MYKQIKSLREYLGLTQKEFGERLGMSKDVVGNLEYNRVQPKEVLIKHIVKIFKVNENWLLTGEGDMFNSEENLYNSTVSLSKRNEESLNVLLKLEPEFQESALIQIKELLRLQNNIHNKT